MRRHQVNYQHIKNHTSQTWADTFINELNDTHVEAEERMRHVPPKVGSLSKVVFCANRDWVVSEASACVLMLIPLTVNLD
jgi:hypothetical protein